MTEREDTRDEFHDLEAAVMADAREVLSETAIDHAMNPRNVGSMADAEATAGFTRPCGDTVQIWLKVEEGKITRATFWTYGCGPAIACSSMVTELAKGRAVEKALDISAEDVSNGLGGLPGSHIHCALLAATALKEAALNYLNSRKSQGKSGRSEERKPDMRRRT